jgi:hypothetical protein
VGCLCMRTCQIDQISTDCCSLGGHVGGLFMPPFPSRIGERHLQGPIWEEKFTQSPARPPPFFLVRGLLKASFSSRAFASFVQWVFGANTPLHSLQQCFFNDGYCCTVHLPMCSTYQIRSLLHHCTVDS